jgi:DNA-binding beta-propeller fold protein YncE
MKYLNHLSRVLSMVGVAMLASSGFAQTAVPYKIVNSAQFMGAGGLDYVFADSTDRRLYVARGPQVHVFDLDLLKEIGTIAAQAHGAVVDPVSHHGFCSSRAVVMFDSKTFETIKIITMQGSPDGMFFEPFTERVYVLSHSAPNVTVIDAKDGTIVDTIDLGGAPEQGQSDGMGHVYIDVVDKANIAVVDAKTLKVTDHYDISNKASSPAGLALDAKNHILFAMCRNPSPTCVILDANDGKILTSLPLAGGSDGGVFNPDTMEAFSSHGNGTLSVIKENSPTSFEIEQTLTTKSGAKTCTLDAKNNQIILITTEPIPAGSAAAITPATPPAASTNSPAGGRRGGRGGPGLLDILVVGR